MALIVALVEGLGGVMGGHESKQSIQETTKISAEIMQKAVNKCVNTSISRNNININGSDNNLSGVTQTASISLSSDCSAFASQNNTFNNDLQSALSQTLKDREVALTQWLDTSKDTQYAAIDQSIRSNFTQETIQSCYNDSSALNAINVNGDRNNIDNILQKTEIDMLSSCILNGQQTSKITNKIADTINQHSEYTSENPLAFISDAAKAIADSIMAVAAVVIIVVICFVFMFFLLRRGGGSSSAEPIFPSMPPITVQMGPQSSGAGY